MTCHRSWKGTLVETNMHTEMRIPVQSSRATQVPVATHTPRQKRHGDRELQRRQKRGDAEIRLTAPTKGMAKYCGASTRTAANKSEGP